MEIPKNLLSNQLKQQLPEQKKNSTNFVKSREDGKSDVTWKIIIGFLIGAIIGAIGVWISLGSRGDKESKNNSIISEENGKNILEEKVAGTSFVQTRKEPVSVLGSNAIAANDQIADDRAEVEMVTLSVSGWVAVHEDRVGALGNILGAQRYESGIHLGEVELLRPMISGSKYHAVLYQDLGERGFNSSEDAPIKNVEGKIIEAIFKAQ